MATPRGEAVTTEPQTDFFDVDEYVKPKRRRKQDEQPAYRIYGGSRIAVSGQVGPMWKKKLDAALKAYGPVYEAWNQAFQYYNFNQTSTIQTPRGTFGRGDGSENIVYSNLNTMLPAVYSKNPDISCSTDDANDKPFVESLQTLLNVLFRRKDKLNAKPKIKKAAGMGLLTNQGVLKLEYTQKDDSREVAIQEIQKLSDELAEASSQEEVNEIYGKLDALEKQMEVRSPSGATLRNVLPHNLIVDPYAEDDDGLDGNYMIERVFELTSSLNERFTQKDGEGNRVYVYKPTHKAVFEEGAEGTREDGLGLVLQTLDGDGVSESHSNEERLAYINMYYTECYLVWDKATRRVMLFAKDDWKWPVWVWDDPYNFTRFYPYFLIGYGMSTGGTTGVGETTYYLDQQDEINDINRQVAQIRRTIFDYFFYNADNIKQDEAEKFFNAIRGKTKRGKHILGIKGLGENRKVSDAIEALVPPSANYEPFFNKEPILNTVNRITNTSDALRGVQFKTNTNEEAVNTYQEAMRLSVGAKVDVIEDVISDLAYAVAELCVQFMTKEEVEMLIGERNARGYEQIPIEQFRASINIQVVAGSMEKPNSVFKKKEAVQIAQGIGQFAQAAPGTALRIMLRVLQKAFTEVVINKSDWDSLDQEIAATLQKGVSTGASPAQPGGGSASMQYQPPANPGGQGAGPAGAQIMQAALALPGPIKQRIMQMAQQGIPNEQIIAFIQQAVQAQQTGASNAQARR